MQALPLLSIMLFLPLCGAPLALILPSRPGFSRALTLVVSGAVLLLAIALLLFYGGENGGALARLTEEARWIPQLGISYRLRLDGISLLLVLLTSLLIFLCVPVSRRSVKQGQAVFHCALLLLESSVIGVFLADDLFLFYLFWELQLLPIFLIIGRWGHEHRLYAAVKFLLFSLAGSFFILAALISLFLLHGRQSGDYTLAFAALRQTAIDPGLANLLFLGLTAGFAVKIPIFPLHTWLPDAHTEAPTAGSVILAGLLLKTGAYGLLRFAVPLFPQAAAANTTLLLVLGLIGLYYASWIAMAQTDMKRLVAYSSIGHMGLVVIGIAVQTRTGLAGAVLQMLNHGITTAALFILVGMLDERFHTRSLEKIGGLWQQIPVFSGFFLFFALSAAGLPGLNNFVSEMLILLPIFATRPLVAGLGLAAMLLTLVYLLRLVRQTLFGPVRSTMQPVDLSLRETCILLPLALLVLFLGLYPGPVLGLLMS
ncbi:MAG: NADH-quinone oxidoreductase subunit M [Desulfobulbaceae bacterium]|nr:NADH-quinone oxidoreductase subunit M [Desulfobulbaceae bacterium]